MFATGKHLKDRAANARRAATTLRQLAKEIDTSVADAGVMLAAATIVEKIANQTAKLGNERKAKEEQYERDFNAALTKTTKIVSGLPNNTTLEKIAVVAFATYRLQFIAKDIETGDKAAALQASLKYWNDDTRRDLAHGMAADFVKGRKTLEAAMVELHERFAANQQLPAVTSLSQRLDRATAPQ